MPRSTAADSSAKIQHSAILHRALFVFGGMLMAVVLGVGGFWAWTRFPLSGDTVYQDSLVTFHYNRTQYTVDRSTSPLSDLPPETLAANSSGCRIPHDADYYRQLLSRFSPGTILTRYDIRGPDRVSRFDIIVLPNELKYSDLPEFKYDFDNCNPNDPGTPAKVSPTAVAWQWNCDVISSQTSADTCRSISRHLLSTLSFR